MTDDPSSARKLEVAGSWIRVLFPHDIRIVQAVRKSEGRRMAIGNWKVPIEQGAELARRLAPLGLDWEGEAAELIEREKLAASGWVAEQAAAQRIKLGAEPLSAEPPVDLMPHQRLGAHFLAAHTGALLADEQGLGKTLTCLAAFWLVRQAEPGTQLLIVCPNSLKRTWRNEIERFFGGWSISVASGSRSSRRKATSTRADVYVVNYEAVRSDRADLRLLLRRRSTVVVCDEAHAVKNLQAQTTQSLGFLRSAATRMWLMTGTPVPNKIEDVYAQITLADEGRTLGTINDFRSRYGQAAEQTAQMEDLQSALEPLILRRTKDEVLHLPERVFEQRWVELTGRQRRLYEDVRSGLRADVEALTEERFEAHRQNILVRLLRLAELASNPRLVYPDFEGPIAKQLEIDDLLTQLIAENGRKVVLWSYYVETIEDMLRRYEAYQPVAIYGKVDLERRAQAVKRFQDDPSTMLFVGNPHAAATGLTLTAASFAIYETISWRFDLYAQSLDRIHRIGQRSNVTYFEVLAADTIDELMRQRLDEKRSVASTLLGDPQALPALTRDEVLAMLGGTRSHRST